MPTRRQPTSRKRKRGAGAHSHHGASCDAMQASVPSRLPYYAMRPTMLTALPYRQSPLASSCLLCLLLNACNGSNSSYPKTWPPLATKSSTKGCSDLQGTYLFEASLADYDGMTFSVLSSFLGAGVSQAQNAPLRTFMIEGDADTQLTATFTSSSSNRTTDPGNTSRRQTITVKRGVDYTCDGGWLVGVFKQDLQVTYPKHHHYDSRNVDYRHGSMGPQLVRLQGDAGGGLVGLTSVRTTRVLSLWAETGAGIPYWFDTDTVWTHWVPTALETGAMPGDVANPAKMGRMERQNYELENGVSATPR